MHQQYHVPQNKSNSITCLNYIKLSKNLSKKKIFTVTKSKSSFWLQSQPHAMPKNFPSDYNI